MVSHMPFLILLTCVVASLAQRGCPQEGCDSRGLNSQADFQISDTQEPDIIWRTHVGNVTLSAQKTIGCVGNDKNVVCRGGNSTINGFVSLNATDGSINWYDDVMKNPRLPIMNLAGDIIAADSHSMEFRLANGSIVGHPNRFYGSIHNLSSLHYVNEPDLFFFVGMEAGGIFLYDASGMCVASYFLDEKDKSSVWIPVSRLVVNTETDPPTAYFLTQNNMTNTYRLHALNFNHLPPYLSEKWHLDINMTVSRETMSANQLLTIGSFIFVSGVVGFYPEENGGTRIILDSGKSGVIKRSLGEFSKNYACLSPPLQNGLRDTEDDTLVWMNVENNVGNEYFISIKGWPHVSPSVGFKYDFNLNSAFNLYEIRITSQIMVFGVHPEDQTVVFGFRGVYAGTGRDYKTGSYVAAIKPDHTSTDVKLLWYTFISPVRDVVGQIIGVNDNMLVVQTYNQTDHSSEVVGIRLSEE